MVFFPDMQSGYEAVHHWLILVTNSRSNGTLQISNPFETLKTSSKNDSSETTEPPLLMSTTALLDNSEEYLDDTNEKDGYYSYSERIKRSASSVVRTETSSINEKLLDESDCIAFLSSYSKESPKQTMENRGDYVGGKDVYLKGYEYCENLMRKIRNKTDENISEMNLKTVKTKQVTEGAQSYVLQTPLKNAENSLEVQTADKLEEKYSPKRSYDYKNLPIAQYPHYESDTLHPHLHAHSDVVPFIRTSDQNVTYITSVQTRQLYPPTGPDGSNYAESVKTSQQLTVANNQIWRPMCFRAQNSPNPSSYVCLPMSRQFDPSRSLHNHFTTNSDSFGKVCPDGRCDKQKTFDNSLPTVITPSTVSSNFDPSRQQILIPPTNSPDLHVPTAISSPNPYFFPTFNGAPIMTHLPRQVPPYFSPSLPYRDGPPGYPYMQLPHLYGPHRIPGGFGGYQQPPLPQYQMLPPQSMADFQNPVFCMYVPSRSFQFPVVDGVAEVKNRNINEDSQWPRPANNSTSHTTYRSGKTSLYPQLITPKCNPFNKYFNCNPFPR